MIVKERSQEAKSRKMHGSVNTIQIYYYKYRSRTTDRVTYPFVQTNHPLMYIASNKWLAESVNKTKILSSHGFVLEKQSLIRQQRLLRKNERFSFQKAKAVTLEYGETAISREASISGRCASGGSLTTSPDLHVRQSRLVSLSPQLTFARRGVRLNDLENEQTDVMPVLHPSLCPYAREAWVIHARDPTRVVTRTSLVHRIPARTGLLDPDVALRAIDELKSIDRSRSLSCRFCDTGQILCYRSVCPSFVNLIVVRFQK